MAPEDTHITGTGVGPVLDKPHIGGRAALCPIVGVGASAGGLEAFQDFVGAAPVGLGLSYVLVQHLDPNHDSLLSELLGRRTELPVHVIENGMLAEPDNVYLLPPNRALSIRDGHLMLMPFDEPRGQRRPIDTFFTALAADQSTNCACVVLSGTGADGSEGLRAVKEAGGLTIAQNPSLAKYDGMPNSAVATGLVDLILPSGDMPTVLHNYFTSSGSFLTQGEQLQATFITRVCEAVRYRAGHDFTHYKPSTISRRIARRMQVVGTEDQGAYIKHLMTDGQEGHLLFRDLLINVTNFFRDPEAFDTLRTDVFPQLLANKGADDTVRVWVPACSSGEEAYSVAILLVEQMSRMSAPPTVNIFATDIDPTMLSMARGGVYPQSAVKDVPPELLERYFIAEEKGYRVTPRIRDMVRFSEHSLIKDPPFSKLDLICCRNLLIYFENDLQSRVIPLFHYALRKDGVLFLGPSENLAGHDRLFAPISSKHRVFKRNNSATRPMPLPLGANGGDRSNHARGERRAMHDAALALDEDLVRRRVVERYAPPFVLVNTEGEVVFASGRTGRYLEFTSGKPSMRILDLAKEGLRSAIRAVLSSSASNTKRVVKRDVRLDLEGQNVTVDVLAEPIDSQTHLIVFQNTTDVTTDQYQDFGVEVTQFTDDMRIRELEDELQEARQSLRSTVEELETSNEELKSSNEEMMSMNEELQSANEELSTINDELKSKIDALAEAKDDMQNFLDSTRLASVFLDSDLKIRSFTPTAAEMLGVADVDVSRSISDLRTRADSDLLEQIAQRVLSTLEPYEGPVQVESTDRNYSLRALPYRTAEDEIKGVVLVFVDVTDLTRAAYALDLARADAEERLIEVEQIYRQTPVAMGLLDAQKRYLRLNDKLAEINGQPLQAMLGKTTGEVVPEIALLVDDLIDQVLQTGEPIIGAEVVGPTPAEPGQDKVFLSDWYPYFVEDQVTAVGVVVQDVTETRAREKQVNFLMHELQHRVKNILANVMALARQAKRSAHPPDVALERLNDRLQSMAQTNNLLALRDWRSADLRALLEAELVAVYGEDRVHLVGPEIALNSKATLSFAMGLHEMATNAAKYGALSVETGRVEVTWLTEDRGEGPMLLLHWVEVKGPGVTEPKDVGFGSSLVTMCFEQSLEGTVDRRFDPNGVTYTLRVPLAQACFEPGEGDANNVHSDRGGRSSGRARPRADA